RQRARRTGLPAGADEAGQSPRTTVDVEGCFIEKKHMEEGLEVADLVAHTAGRQRRHQIAGKQGVTKDFEQMYWQRPIPPAFMAIDSVALDELSLSEAGTGTSNDA